MDIAIFEADKQQQHFLKKKLGKHNVTFFKETIQHVPLEKLKKFSGIGVFVFSKVTAQIMSSIPKLKLVVTLSTGFDHIDLEYCKSKGIAVANVPFYGENTVAEHAFALMLSLSRNVHKSYLRTIRNDYSQEGLRGFDLKEKTLGVIGVGHIGLHVIRIARGFGMHVKAFDLNKDKFISELLNYSYVDINDLLKTSDIITLHMPYLTQTHHFLDRKKLSLTKKGVVIINTARGGLIDTDALYELLRSGHIGGAGLDVIEGEEFIKEGDKLLNDHSDDHKIRDLYRDKEILGMDNVIFTPHIAFNSAEAIQRILETTVENINAFDKMGKVKYSCIR